MALEEFENEQLPQREKNLVTMRSITNYVMGIFLIGVGFMFMFPVAATQQYLAKYDSSTLKMFAVICWLYGLFRIYRGYKKNYFKG